MILVLNLKVMDFYKQIFDEDSSYIALSKDNWSLELSVIEVLWQTWEKFTEIFYYQLYLNNSDRKITEVEMQKLLIKLFWDDVHSHLLGDNFLGDAAKEKFFENALGNTEDTEETLNFCLFHVIGIVCKYACDTYIHYCEYPNDNKYVYYLCQAEYFKGLLVASHADKVAEKQELKDKMVELANKRHAEKKQKDMKNLTEVQKIWTSKNWATYTECANDIHRNQLIDEDNYRKIYDLVSKAAKIKN